MVYPPIPREIYEYPLVQYIPIPVETMFRGPRTLSGDWPYLKVIGALQEYLHWQKTFNLISPASRPPSFEECVVVLAANVQVDDCTYRAEKAILIGSVRPGWIQVFRLTRKYFYRDSLDLVLYDYRGRILAMAPGASGSRPLRAAAGR